MNDRTGNALRARIPATSLTFAAGAFTALAALVPVGAVAQDAAPDAAVVVLSGEEAAAQGDWDAAVAAFAAAAESSDSAAAWYRLGVARAVAGDAAGAAHAFRAVAERDPDFPEIGARIAAADARAAADEAELLDRPGFHTDPEVRLEARRDALARADRVYATRAAVGLEPGAGADADAAEAVLDADPERAAVYALAAVSADPSDPDAYLAAADALRLAGRLDAARYYLNLHGELGGDPRAAAAVRDALRRAEQPGL